MCTVYRSRKLGHRCAPRQSLRQGAKTRHFTRKTESDCLKVDSSYHFKTTQCVCYCNHYKKSRKNSNIKTQYLDKDDQRSTIKHSNTARVAKQYLLEPVSVTKIKVTTKLNGPLHFDSGPSLVTQGSCLHNELLMLFLMAYFLV